MTPSLLASALEKLELLDVSKAIFLPLQIQAIFRTAAVQTEAKTLKIGQAIWLHRDDPLYGRRVFEIGTRQLPQNAGNLCEEVAHAAKGGRLPVRLLMKLDELLIFGHFEMKIENNQFKMVAENNSCLQTSSEFKCTLCEAIFLSDLSLIYHKISHIQRAEQIQAGTYRRPPACRSGDYCRFHSQHRCKFHHVLPPPPPPPPRYWTPVWYPVV